MKVSREIPAPRNDVWKILSDFGSMAKWSPDLSASAQVARRGIQVGAVRDLSFRKPQGNIRGVTERITACGDGWFTYVLDGGIGEYPEAGSTWRVVETPGGCRVEVETVLVPGTWRARLLHPLARRGLRQGLRRALNGLAAQAIRVGDNKPQG